MFNLKLNSFDVKFKKLVGYAIWIFVCILVASTVKNINRVISIRKQVEQEKSKVTKMEADNENLKNQIAEAQGSDFIEKQIRDKLGLTKEGETVVVLPDSDFVRSLAPPEPNMKETLPDANWLKWKKLFF